MATKNDFIDLFKQADKDKSGFLTLTELCSAMRILGYKGKDDIIKNYFGKADLSNDQKISYDEFMKSVDSMPPQLHRAALMRKIFTRFDIDGNGTLDKKELQRATAILGDKFSSEDIGILMEILDKDNSGTIDCEEFIQSFMDKKR